ncbi:MAG: hypothetical protein DRP63_04370 [Planctomycetota bacterium]|nr:MAG: hypothetical protein DRP63_04370 [Planctomycetota bacterium]
MRRRLRRTFKSLYRHALWALGKLAVLPFCDMPQPLLRFLLFNLHPLWMIFESRHRKVALLQVKEALSVNEVEAKRIVREMFRNIRYNIVEFISLPRAQPKRILQAVDGEEYVREVRRLRRSDCGVIVATGHIGFWELFGAYSSLRLPTTVIAKRIYFPRYEREVAYLRRRFGMRVVYQDEGIKPVLVALRRGDTIGMLVDQDIKSVAGVYVRFFGKEAYTPSAPSALSVATGAPILPAAIIRLAPNKHRIIFEEPIFPPAKVSDKVTARLHLTQKWTSALERIIRRYPQQWVWFHKRWKTRPENLPAPRISVASR